MNASLTVRAIAITSLFALVAAAPPQVMRSAPRPVIQNQTAPRPPRRNPDPQGSPPPAEEYTSLAIKISTGDDDLRSSSKARVTVYFTNNTQVPCDVRPNEETWENGSTHDAPPCVFPVPVTLDQLKQAKVMLSYDGGNGDSLQTYDNWDVGEVRIEAVNSAQHLQKCLLDVSKNPYLVRMTGDQRALDLTETPSSC